MAGFRREARRIVHIHALPGASRDRYVAVFARVARDLAALGLHVEHPRNLRARHLYELVAHWRPLMGAGALHNLVSAFRTLHGWSGSANRLPDNQALGLPSRLSGRTA